MAFITDTQLKTSLAAMLHKRHVEELEAFWDTVITAANESAYNEILARLLDRGFTLAQILTWDRGAEFNRYIGLYRALITGVTADAYDDTWPEKLKWWLDELTTTPIVADGLIVTPGDEEGRVGHGTLSTANDIFSLDPDNPELGEPTEW